MICHAKAKKQKKEPKAAASGDAAADKPAAKARHGKMPSAKHRSGSKPKFAKSRKRK